MTAFNIQPVSQNLTTDLQHKIDFKTKPLGALGKLETLALQIGNIQQSLSPQLKKPTIVVFAGDHGIAAEGVSPYPQEVTYQMVLNFLAGGAAINVFCAQNNIDIKIVDAGVAADFDPHPKLINAKIGAGTRNYLREPAMTGGEAAQAIVNGAGIVQEIHTGGCNVIGFGEMGIGNTSSASILMSLLGEIPIEDCVGRGTGLDDAGLAKKRETLASAIAANPTDGTPLSVLATFGGFEIAMMVGAMLQAAELEMVVLIDGFITTAALLVASKMYPEVLDYCVFSHQSDEQGHQKMLALFNADPILHLGMRLGEGSGAAVAYPILQSAVNFLNDMASFESANVSQAE